MRRALSLVLAFGLLLTSAISVSAQTPTDETESDAPYSVDSPVGYYLWHNDNGFHLRTHGPGDEHDFTARLHTDGFFENVDSLHTEAGDNVAVTDGGHTLLIHFHTFGLTDGVNFRIRRGNDLRLNLQLDGSPIATDSIYLGQDGSHPDSNPFTLHAWGE